MMVFSLQPGYAVAVKTPMAAPMLLGIENWGNIASGAAFASRKAIITGISWGEEDNYQKMHTLRNFRYLHVLGQKFANIMVSGIAFNGICYGGGEGGPSSVRRFFNQNRISKKDAAVGVAIGGVAFRGFLVKMNQQVNNPEAGLGQFALQFEAEASDD